MTGKLKVMNWYTLNSDHTVTKLPEGEYPDFEQNRHVGDTYINGIRISTVFLGLDHAFYPGRGPILFETMIFGGEYHDYQNRYYTWDEANDAHTAIVRAITEGVHPETYLKEI